MLKQPIWALMLVVLCTVLIPLTFCSQDEPSKQQQQQTQMQNNEFEQRVGELVAAGMSRADAEASVRATMRNEADARVAKEPAQIRPPSYRLYKSNKDGETAYIVAVHTTDEQLKNLLWFFRKKVQAGAFGDIGIRKSRAGMLLVYRGEKCANEEFISNA